jgi:hypothetical protein
MSFKKFVNDTAIPLKKRRGLSQIMGGLLMLAIVVPLGSVVLLSGVTEITAFNNSMSNTIEYRNNGIQEDLVFEHIRFEPSTQTVTISAFNTGSVDIVVDRITLVNMSNQDILFKIDSVSDFIPVVLSVQNSTDIDIDVDLDRYAQPPDFFSWNDGQTPTTWDYRISIITARGNFFDTVARPFNT